MNVLKKLTKNEHGRDFVVGDIHGQYDKLIKGLQFIKFNKSTDRLISVGDLIDRGTKCNEVLKLLWEPWFFAVQGNHDLMMADYFEDRHEDKEAQWYLNGGGWLLDYIDTAEPEDFKFWESCVEKIKQLPLAFEIECETKTVGICHAEPPLDWKVLETAKYDDVVGLLTWSRNFFRGRSRTIKGIDEVYVGHTIVDTPLKIHNVFFIDTGAFRKPERKLTFVDLEKGIEALSCE